MSGDIMKKPIAAAVSLSIALSGCATASKDLSPTYVSPMQFQAYDCDQLASENQRLQSRVSQLGGRLDQAASNDKALAGVGAILFWPALFALGGTKQQEAEYSRLKGEHGAIEQSAILRKCPGIVATSNPVVTPAPVLPTSNIPPAVGAPQSGLVVPEKALQAAQTPL